MTPPRQKMESSTPRLSEFAQHFVFPDGIVKTVWPRVEAKGRELGIGFDWWQRQLNSVILGYRADGVYAASVGGIGMSIPRQVGKTYDVLALLVIMCILFPGLQVVWTAHHLRTSTRTFRSLQGLLKLKNVAPHVAPGGVRLANGEQQVVFANGSMIMFGARQYGFGRGFEELDIEVFDEAQILDTRALEDMVAATNQARHEHGALLFFMGTPPRPLDPSEAFTLRRTEAISGDSEDAVWLEIGADAGSDPDDRKQWVRMNPSYPARTPLASMLRLRKNLGDEDSWNREGRGIWDEDVAKGAFRTSDWIACQGQRPQELALSGLALAVSSDLDFAAIVAAGVDDLETVHVRPLQHAPGTGWIVERAKELQARFDVPLVVDSRSPASMLIPVLEREGVKLHVAKTEDALTACGTIDRLVHEHELRHEDFDVLNRQVEIGERRKVGDRWAWKRPSGVNISALEAATLAAWKAIAPEGEKAPEPRVRVIGGRA